MTIQHHDGITTKPYGDGFKILRNRKTIAIVLPYADAWDVYRPDASEDSDPDPIISFATLEEAKHWVISQ